MVDRQIKISRLVILAIVLMINIFCHHVIVVAQSVAPLPDVLQGELPNGFRYVLKQNFLPHNRINFRLVLNIGSLQEQEGEEGAAHFIEHLAFRTTTHFSDGEIVRILESLGEKYGVTINACTGYDRTIYMFSIPSDAPESLELGIRIASEWLSEISFDSKVIEREKAIVLEEISGYRCADCLDLLKKGSDSRLHRFPIGKVEQIQKITPQSLEHFYCRNYQSHNASLIISGAFDNNEKAQTLISNVFGKLSGDAARRIEIAPLKYSANTTFEASPDVNRHNASIEWIYPIAALPVLTTAQLIDQEKDDLVLSMLNTHLRRKNNPMRLSKQWYLAGTDHFCFEVEAKDDAVLLEKFREGISIIEGVRRNGFSEYEAERQKKSYLARNKNMNFQYTSEQWCDYFTDILLLHSRDIATEEESLLINQAIAATSLDEWNRHLRHLLQIMDEQQPVIGYSFSPKLHKEIAYNDVLTSFKKACNNPDTTSVVEYSQQNASCNLDDADFLNSPIEEDISIRMGETAYYPNLQVEEITLDNGSHLLLKQTTNKDSTVLVTLLFHGGLSEIPAEQYPLLESVASYMSIGGIEGVDDELYDNALVASSLSVINTMEPYWHGMMASGKSDNLRQLANLIFNRCFYPKKCYSDFDEIKEELRSDKQKDNDSSAMTRFISDVPERLLRKRVDELAGNTLPQRNRHDLLDPDKLDLDSIAEFYNRLYTRSTGLSCIVVGNMDMSAAKKIFTVLLSRFKPCESIDNGCADPEERPSSSVVEKVTDDICPDRLSFDYLHSGTFSAGMREVLILKLMKELLVNRVIQEVRNKEGLIYSPYVDLYYHTTPYASFCFDINGSLKAENASALKLKIDAIIQDFQNYMPTEEELSSIKSSFYLTKNAFLTPKTPANWKEYLTTCVKEQISMKEAENYEKILATITPNDILMAFQKWMKPAQKTFLYTGTLQN